MILFQIGFHAHGCGHTAGSQQVMAAAMALSPRYQGFRMGNAGFLRKAIQSIIFSQESHKGMTTAEGGPECRGNVCNSLFHRESFFFQESTQQLHGTIFRVPDFRMIPYGIAQCNEILFLLFDSLQGFCFFRFHIYLPSQNRCQL